MGEGEFRVELREREPGPTGADEVAFLDPAERRAAVRAGRADGLGRRALADRARDRRGRGGETMVFDEIDAGIGGETAHAVAETLARLAERAQVVTITHLPQIASRAERHFRVEKVPGDPTHTRIEQLDDDERRAEIERMLGGREFLARTAAPTSPDGQRRRAERSRSSSPGPARLDRRTKHLVRRLAPDDIAIIDHTDLDRVSAEELVESGVRVVVNVAESRPAASRTRARCCSCGAACG